MYAIKNNTTGEFAKHTGETDSEGYYIEYPWMMVKSIKEAQKYTTLEHANEIAFWHLDHTEKWVLVNDETGEEFEKKMGKYLPV